MTVFFNIKCFYFYLKVYFKLFHSYSIVNHSVNSFPFIPLDIYYVFLQFDMLFASHYFQFSLLVTRPRAFLLAPVIKHVSILTALHYSSVSNCYTSPAGVRHFSLTENARKSTAPNTRSLVSAVPL